jgi:cell division FtsZ-interacting protein ZapD
MGEEPLPSPLTPKAQAMTLTLDLLRTVEQIAENLEARRLYVWDDTAEVDMLDLDAMAQDMHDAGVETEAQIDAYLADLW